ncbi:hypothetical protein FOZ60_017460 [Perkinsus olseni]|uniref:Uncharacterized protein n=1 Tax=Perkinsus olseni TaxID=32597 RepID=A0A7J6N0Y3_PEROL|nr:hypothetical protein FOZ60_017460 [Perkinsus olseni]
MIYSYTRSCTFVPSQCGNKFRFAAMLTCVTSRAVHSLTLMLSGDLSMFQDHWSSQLFAPLLLSGCQLLSCEEFLCDPCLNCTIPFIHLHCLTLN